MCGTCAPGTVCDLNQCIPESGSSSTTSSSSTSASTGAGGSANGAGGGATGGWIPLWGRAGCAVEPGRDSEKDARFLAFAAIAMIGLARRRRAD
jgi:MYXO-CTERM domain-containing protein